MTWLFYGLAAFLAVLVLLEYRLAYIAYKRNTNANRSTRKILLVLTLLTIIAQPIIDKIDDAEKSKQQAELRRKVDRTNTNVVHLMKQNLDLLAALSTNTSISPETRIQVLELSRAVELVNADVSDLEQWKTDFKNEQAARKQKHEAARLKQQIAGAEHTAMLERRVEQTWKRASQLFDFIIRTVQQAVQSAAKTTGDKVFSDYVGLPATVPIGKQPRISSITTGTNLGWSFQISAEAILRNDGAEVWLRVFGSCTNRPDRIVYQTMFKASEVSGRTNLIAESHLQLNPYNTEFTEPINLEGYQTNTTAWVRRFMGAHANRCEKPR